jgi:small-conductance mechanosensitive channel
MTLWQQPALPVVFVGLAGILVWSLVPRHLASMRLVVQIAFFLVMSFLSIKGAIVPFVPERGDWTTARLLLIGAAKLLWWVHFAWVLIGLVRIGLVLERQPREARLLQDVVVGVVYAGSLLSILAFVFAMPVGTLIATSGVFAIILGLALQTTLSDVFSGIALTLGRPYVLGDWIELSNGVEGRVVETDWRSTRLLTPAHNVVTLPNSLLAKQQLINVSTPDESHALSLTVRLAPTHTPAVLMRVVSAALASCDAIAKEPTPLVIARSLDAAAVELDLVFSVANVAGRLPATNAVVDLVDRHCRAAGLHLAMPASSLLVARLPSTTGTAATAPWSALALFRATQIFAPLSDEELQTLAVSASVLSYQAGEVIARRGDMLSGLMVVKSGTIVRHHTDTSGIQREIDHLAPGDLLDGNRLPTKTGASTGLRASSHVTLLAIDPPKLASLLSDHPHLAAAIAEKLPEDGWPNSAAGQARPATARVKFSPLSAIRKASSVAFRRTGREDPRKETQL